MFFICNQLSKSTMFFLPIIYIITIASRRTTFLSPPPECKNCVNYIPSDNFNEEYGRCRLYCNMFIKLDGKKKITYEYAKHTRATESMCGKEGVNFEENSEYLQ